MSFLQSRNNLGDVESMQQARDNLGIGSLASQPDANVDIKGGRATLAELSLPLYGAKVTPGYVLAASNQEGVVVWRELAVASWMNRPSHEVSLAGLCNDANFVTETELHEALNTLTKPTLDLLIGDVLNIPRVSASNVVASNLEVELSAFAAQLTVDALTYSGPTPSTPSALINLTGDATSPLELVALETAYDSDALIPSSARAVSNLYAYVREVARNIPDETGGFMVSTNNFADIGLNPIYAVSNLGLNEAFFTDHITLKDVVLTEPSYNGTNGAEAAEFVASSSKTYKLLKEAKTNRLVYEENKLVHAYTDRTKEYPASAYNVNTLYEHLDGRINDQLLIHNVLSELIENRSDGSENPYRSVFRQRLRSAGVHEVAFSGSWSDLYDAPRSLSAFDNMGGNGETMFLYSKSNFADLPDTVAALRNLGIADVAISGNISDLKMSGVLRTVLDTEGASGGIAQACMSGALPFLATENGLRELADNPAIARSNLGLGDMATFDRYGVEIMDGTATLSDCVIRSNLQYLHQGVDGARDAASTDPVFLKCVATDGQSEWARLPRASETAEGVVVLTHDYLDGKNPGDAVALSAHAASNMFAALMVEISSLKQQLPLGG